MTNNLAEKLKEISDLMTEENIKSMSNEELMGYLFLVEKVKVKLEKIAKLADENK